ncbi:MAG TPA: sugar ABC transporter permease [Clostridiales bacterium UBA8960]|nr:sugar ABC transporter permease [Clostridiales bacterium UBA8960]
MKKRHSAHKKRHQLMGYLFMSPWILGFILFTGIPFFYTIHLSFQNVTLTVKGWETTWNQFDNYLAAFFRNTEFIPGIINFVIYIAIYAPVIIIISFILAILLNQKIKFRAGFRLIYFLPVIIMSGSVMQQLMDTGSTHMSSIESAMIFKIIANYSDYLAYAIAFLFDNFSMVLWFTGIPIILFINGLQKINGSLYEAAQIDGASHWQMLWKITVPLIKPIVFVASVFTIVQLGMYNLNPVYKMIQDTIFNTQGGLGLASAFAWIYTVVVFAAIGVAFLLLRDKEESS